MTVREYTNADLDRIVAIHKQARMGYLLPPMDTFFSKQLVEDGSGLGMAVLQKLTSEVYLICNPNWRNPPWRWQAMKRLAQASYVDAKSAGVREAVAFIPPTVEKRFKRRLHQLGFEQAMPIWNCYAREIS